MSLDWLWRDRTSVVRAVALSSLLLASAGCTEGPSGKTERASDFLTAPADAVDRWDVKLNLTGSGVYISTAEAYPLRNHVEYEAELLAMVHANQNSSFIMAEISVFNRTENRDSGGGGASFQSAREHVGLGVWANGQNVIDPLWIVDNPWGFDGGGGRSTGPIAGPKPTETQTLMLVVAYATKPDNDHPLPATVDLVVTSPERNLVPLFSSHRIGGTGAASYISGELRGTDGIGITTGEAALGAESNVTLSFTTTNGTLVRWLAYAPMSPGAEGVAPLRVPTGRLDLQVTNNTGSRNFELGLNRPNSNVHHDYIQHGGEAWEFNFEVQGRANVFVAYADAPFASTWNLLTCDFGTRPCEAEEETARQWLS